MMVDSVAQAETATVQSEDAPKQMSSDEPVLKEVVVSAPKLTKEGGSFGNDVDIRELMPMMRAASSDATSLLQHVPGTHVIGNGGVSGLPVMHGLGDDRLRVQVDGMNLISACPNHMNSPLSYIDPVNVGSVKVYSGVTPVSEGGDSIGGTIRMHSPAPEFAKHGEGTLLKGEAGSFYRSNGDGIGGHLTATVAGEQLGMTYTGSIARSGNYEAAHDFKASGLAATDRSWLAGDIVGSSRYKAENHALGMAVRHEGHLLELKLGLQDIPYEGFPNQRMDMVENDSQQVNLHYTGNYQWGTLESRLYHERTKHKMDFAEDKQYYYGSAATILAPGMPMFTEGKNLGGLIKAEIPLSNRDILRLGSEAQRYRLDDWWPPSPATLPAGYTMGGMAPNTFWNIKDGQRDRLDFFAEWEARWNAQWLSQFGLRSDTVKMDTGKIQGYNNSTMYGDSSVATSIPGKFNNADRSRTDDNIDVTALLRYTPEASRSFEMGYSLKTRSPNLYERFSWSTNTMAMEMNNFAGDGNYYVGNLDLSPEKAHSFSVTADFHDPDKKRWGIKVTPYLTYVEDYIDARRCPASVCGSSAAVTSSLTATTGFVYLQYVNQNARLYGLDVSGYAPLWESDYYGNIIATGMVDYVRGENRTTGDNLYNIMPLNAKLALVHHLGSWTNTIEEQVVSAKTKVSQTRDEVPTAGYGLLNMRSSYDWKQWRLDLGVENVLDKFYNPPLGGAYVGQGATMSGSAIPWGVAVPGPGRLAYVGATVRF
ncbi:MAG: TonB-dependent receptor [Magnetococcales bacterium]|nr:TonB-dependent receptor [Magnetococcales bacterium]